MTDTHTLLLIMVSAGITMLLRFFPFLVFGNKKETPSYITYLASILPYAIMGMLVVYCLRNTQWMKASHGLPECLATLVVVGSYVWKRNTLLSIAGGHNFIHVFCAGSFLIKKRAKYALIRIKQWR